MTGLHATHMLIGFVLLSVIAWMAHKGRFSPEWYTPGRDQRPVLALRRHRLDFPVPAAVPGGPRASFRLSAMAGHVSPKSTYYAIFGALMVRHRRHGRRCLRQPRRSFNFPVAIGIAITKATLVILFFMHAKYSSKLTKLFVGTAFFFLLILLTLTMTDFLSRGMRHVPGWCSRRGFGVRQPRPQRRPDRSACRRRGTLTTRRLKPARLPAL